MKQRRGGNTSFLESVISAAKVTDSHLAPFVAHIQQSPHDRITVKYCTSKEVAFES
jgi:hypothetical protein